MNFKTDEIEARVKRARGRAVIGLGEGVATHGKIFVHVESGDLRRSIHAAAPGSGGEVAPDQLNVQRPGAALLEVGSWLPYACVEETGRMHQYMHPAIEAVRPQAYRTVKAAFREEGFT